MPILVEIEGAVAFVTISMPPVNALDENALNELMQALVRVENDEAVRAVVFTGGIAGIFCSGGDLKYWPRAYPSEAHLVGKAGRDVFTRIENLPKPTLAAINGRVIGDGLSLVMACDIRIASLDSTFRLPELDYGFIPGWGTIGRLVELVGKPFATEMLLSGDEITAERALSAGLVNRTAPAHGLTPYVVSLARELSTKPRLAIHQAKTALQGDSSARRRRDEQEEACFTRVWGSSEWREGIDTFFRAKAAR